MHIISEQAKRLRKMIAALLDISRLEQGRLMLERAPVDICALTKRVVEEVQPGLMAHTVECIGLAASSLVIDGDELRLEQVLQNLIGNAVKYSLNGGPVRVLVEQRGDMACITSPTRAWAYPPRTSRTCLSVSIARATPTRSI